MEKCHTLVDGSNVVHILLGEIGLVFSVKKFKYKQKSIVEKILRKRKTSGRYENFMSKGPDEGGVGASFSRDGSESKKF